MKFPTWLYVIIRSSVVALGAGSLTVLVWSRGEPVRMLEMVVASGWVFAVAYRFQSAWLMAKALTMDELRAEDYSQLTQPIVVQ